MPILFIALVVTTCHSLFSPLGFNPTDDGFTLAYTRRIVDGQIPHRDFITIRPILSPVVHIPIFLLAGDHLYLYSRLFVWFQFALISWIWVGLIERSLCLPQFAIPIRVALSLVCFTTSVNLFPIMAWHTVDGIFLIVIGLYLCTKTKPSHKTAGYLILGLAYLCKQNFVFVAPATLLIMGDWRKWRYWLATALPGIFYLAFMFAEDGLDQAILQLTSQSTILFAKFKTYFYRGTLIAVFLGYLAGCLIFGKNRTKTVRDKGWKWVIGFTILLLIPAVFLSGSPNFGGKAVAQNSFIVFGLIGGIMFYELRNKPTVGSGLTRVAAISLVTAWTVSLSIGYGSPALFSGQLLVVLLAYAYCGAGNDNAVRLALGIIVVALTIASLSSFALARMHRIYREQPAMCLTHRLDNILPGGKGVRTNSNCYQFLVDLHKAIEASRRFGETYSIIPDCAGWWPRSDQPNPLAMDWPQSIELKRVEMVKRLTDQLDSLRSRNIVIVQKVEADALAKGFVPLSAKYKVVNHVRQNYEKVFETTFFELYK